MQLKGNTISIRALEPEDLDFYIKLKMTHLFGN